MFQVGVAIVLLRNSKIAPGQIIPSQSLSQVELEQLFEEVALWVELLLQIFTASKDAFTGVIRKL